MSGAGPMAAPARDWRGTGWRERLLDARDRLLASPRFRARAAAFPLTRGVARRRARALFDLCAGFVYSQVLLACVRLRLFDILAEGPQTRAVLARRLSLSPEATDRLLDAAASLRLVAARGGDRVGLGPLGAAMVGNPGIAAMVEHHALLYADLSDPVALLRTGGARQLAGYWPYAEAKRPAALGAGDTGAYTALMAASQPMVAAEILDAYPVARHRRLLDLGGGDGTFLTHVVARAPNLALMLFDLPSVAAQARARLEQAGLGARVTVTGGDFRADALPAGADIVTLVRVIHDHDDAAALAILRAARAALPAGGTLLLAEPMAETRGAEPSGAAYFGFYLLAMGSGRPRTQARLSEMLTEAGFADVRPARTHTPLLVRLLVARA